jgi:tetratricopeptide (TPR) repeat protein/predicted Ser/Thr protein kinase
VDVDPAPSSPTEARALAPPRPVSPGDATQTAGPAEKPEVEAPKIPAGERIGRYVVRRELGRGGVGVVLEAYDPALDRPVALKLLIAGRDATDAQLRRFLREARAASSLRHPNIIPVHDLGEVDGRAYFAMEKIEGRSLGDILKAEGPMPPRRAFEVARDVARALEHAHAHGIVHRDVKPENILVDARGHAYLSDFGLARDLDLDARLTATGVFIGTPAYAPPEQIAGHEIDGRADIYSLGATIFEALTGRPPFEGASFALLASRVMHEMPPAIRARVPTVARDAETICLVCLEKEPARRYATAGLLAADLERFLRGEDVRARTAGAVERAWRRARRHRFLVVTGGLAAMGLLGVVVYAAELRVELRGIKEEERRLQERERSVFDAHIRSEARVRVDEERRRVLSELVGETSTEARLALLAKALEIDPDYWEGRCDRARLLLQLAAERRRASDPGGALVAARAARAEVASALAHAPTSPRAPLLLVDAEACRRFLGDKAAALAGYRLLAAGAEDGSALAAYARGRVAQAAGDRAAALAAAATASERAPSFAPARSLAAELALEAGDPNAAIAALDEAGRQGGAWDDPERFVLRGIALEALGEEQRAVEDLDHALELDPCEPRARCERGRIRLMRGEGGLALSDLDRAVLFAPDELLPVVLRAMARSRQGLDRGADADLETASRLGLIVTPEIRAFLLGRPGVVPADDEAAPPR